MPPVFAHGRLRLYLLKLLDEAPRHGYEVIRLLEERFQGLYAPSAGTVYPRLAKLESEGLVTHATEGGRKVYSITDAGRAELAGRSGELAELELEIRESVSELAAEIREDVRGAAGRLRNEMRAATKASRDDAPPPGADAGGAGPGAEQEAWRTTREEMRRAKQEWKEQARRAKDESRRAREEAQRARRQAKEAQEFARDEVLRVARQVQDQVQVHFARGDWPTGVREGLSELAGQLGGLAKGGWPSHGVPHEPADRHDPADEATGPAGTGPSHRPRAAADTATDSAPEWAADTPSTDNPERDLERLLDRFRDDVRDAARDQGVTAPQLGEIRRHLSTAAAHVTALLHTGGRQEPGA
ncbi:PadR family transcriptional regulator [Streptomyces sp. NBC_01497]|uniref:PadR family transcriptional regulator n=1 Tax=Streptomyces sp. NBC_01497 TaxID=2903885 RepID=UPI002E37E65C|nr:helix-turn-helix transcriptional regulator [Streptomyces sp. NBC_01497]